MSKTKIKQLLFLQILGILLTAAVSCNSKTSDDESEIAVTPALVAVKNFHLKANDSILAHLDSVAFSIDLNTGVIFNADSLPKGTDVSKLIASITFANSMTKADITFINQDFENITIDYLTNPDDTINFTHPVSLDVTAQDGVNTFSYQIRVNVHQQEPDTLTWSQMSTCRLPANSKNPLAQKTVIKNDIVYSIIMEEDMSFTLASSSDLNEGIWETFTLNIPFIADVESFTATSGDFYILDLESNLYSSEDAKEWQETGQKWVSILGGYGEHALGVKKGTSGFLHSMYPETESFVETPVDPAFPLSHSSSLGIMESKWSPLPYAIMAGGLMEGGIPTNAVWAFDGENWAVINDSSLPALDMPLMARYIVYRDTPAAFTQREFDIWILFGGMTADDQMNREVYISYNNGVNWEKAPELMQLPESIPAWFGSNVIMVGYYLSSDLSQAWEPLESTRASYNIDGYEITWLCPYLYIFGGYPDSYSLSTTIWRGVLTRLQFTPII